MQALRVFEAYNRCPRRVERWRHIHDDIVLNNEVATRSKHLYIYFFENTYYVSVIPFFAPRMMMYGVLRSHSSSTYCTTVVEQYTYVIHTGSSSCCFALQGHASRRYYGMHSKYCRRCRFIVSVPPSKRAFWSSLMPHTSHLTHYFFCCTAAAFFLNIMAPTPNNGSLHHRCCCRRTWIAWVSSSTGGSTPATTRRQSACGW